MFKFRKRLRFLLISLIAQLGILYLLTILLIRDYHFTPPKTFELIPLPPPAEVTPPKKPVKKNPVPSRRLQNIPPLKQSPQSKLSVDKDSPPGAKKTPLPPPKDVAPGSNSTRDQDISPKSNSLDFDPNNLFIHTPESATPPQSTDKKPELGEVLANLEKYLNFQEYSSKTSSDEDTFGVGYTDSDFNYLWYGRIIKQRVADGWFPPYAARIGATGRTVITFRIQKSGAVGDIKLRETSGNESLDRAALNAVRSVSYLPPLPDDYAHDTLGVIFSFLYNLTVPEK